MERCNKRFRNAEFDEAINLLKQCLSKTKVIKEHKVQSYKLFGKIYISIENKAQAKESFWQMLELDPAATLDPAQETSEVIAFFNEVQDEFEKRPQPVEARQLGLRLAVNAGGVVPMSDLKDIAGPGFAANVYLAYMLSESFGIEGHVGYHKFGSEEIIQGVDVSGAFIPVKVGIVKLWGESKRFYTNPSVGIYSGVSDFDGPDFGLGPRIGYLFPLGDGAATLDVGAEFHNIFSDFVNSRYFGVSVGAVFNF